METIISGKQKITCTKALAYITQLKMEHMRESGRKEKGQGMEFLLIMRAIGTRGCMKMISKMGKGQRYLPIVKNMSAILKTAQGTAMESTTSKMVGFTKGTGKTICRMDTENLQVPMVQFMKGTGKKTKKMAQEFFIARSEK